MRALAHLMLAGLLFCGGCARLNPFKHGDTTVANGLSPGTPAPELVGEDFSGNRVNLADHRGKVVVVVFWASWCPPCRAMIPHERALAERHSNDSFILIGVNNDQNPDA